MRYPVQFRARAPGPVTPLRVCSPLTLVPYNLINLSLELFLRRTTRSMPRRERRRWGGRRATEWGNGSWRVHEGPPRINLVVNPNVNA